MRVQGGTPQERNPASALSLPGRYWSGVVANMGYSRAFGWLAMYALARIVVVRRIARWFVRRDAPSFAAVGSSIFEADAVRVAETLRWDGFAVVLRLPDPIVRELVTRALESPASAGSTPFSIARPSEALGERIAGDPMLRALAGHYLGASAIYQGSRLWWTMPGEAADPRLSGARFHYDLYDYRALTVLFYLTDVGPDSGPHVCVRASHRRRRWRDQLHPRRHRTDGEIVRLYGEDRIVTICGPAGTGIAEDPFCFHKVTLPVKRERLALQLLYTGSDVPAPSFTRAQFLGAVGGFR